MTAKVTEGWVTASPNPPCDLVIMFVMPGRGDEALLRADVPGIHLCGAENVDGRDKPGHDEALARKERGGCLTLEARLWCRGHTTSG
jgi:hypothetical protein